MCRFVDTHTLVAAAIGMLAGVCWLFEQSVLPGRLLLLMSTLLCTGLVIVFRRRRSVWITPMLTPVLAFALMFVTGFTLASLESERRLSGRLDPSLHGDDILLSGEIDGLVTRDFAYTGFVLKSVVADDAAVTVPYRLKLGWYGKAPTLQPGERWQMTIRLREIHGTQNPGGFDVERWALAQNIGGKGYVRNPGEAKRIEHSPWYTVDALRARIVDDLAGAVSNDHVAGVLRALSVGDRSGLTHEQWQMFRDTGTSHLIAISGLHIGFVAMLVGGFGFGVARLWSTPCRYVPARVIGVAMAVVAATGYAALAGFSVSTQRALVMVVIVAVALIARTRSRLVRALALSLIVVLAMDPLTPLSFGLWLSFGAVALIATMAAASHPIEASNRVRSFGTRTLTAVSVWGRLQFVLSLAMLPVSLFLFGQASLCSIIANAFAIPWTTFLVVPSLLTGLLLEPVSGTISNALLQFAALAVQLMSVVLEQVSRLPYATVTGPAPSVFALALFIVAAIALTLARLAPLTWLTLVWCAPVLFPQHAAVADSLKVTMLDVGQGLSVVVQTGKRTLVFDTGASAGGSDLGARVVVPYLRAKNVSEVDAMIVSHADNDHAGGLGSTRRAFDTPHLLVGDQSIEQSAQQCVPGQAWQWGDTTFSILAPLATSGTSENDRSCVLLVSSDWGRVLLTGDIEEQGEQALVEAYGADLRADVLIVPHHGAKTSSTLPFLEAVGPSLALVSAGHRNRFGHPHTRVMQRYEQLGVATVNTADAGAITVSLSESGVVVEEFRRTHQRFWHRRVQSGVGEG